MLKCFKITVWRLLILILNLVVGPGFLVPYAILIAYELKYVVQLSFWLKCRMIIFTVDEWSKKAIGQYYNFGRTFGFLRHPWDMIMCCQNQKNSQQILARKNDRSFMHFFFWHHNLFDQEKQRNQNKSEPYLNSVQAEKGCTRSVGAPRTHPDATSLESLWLWAQS